MLKRFKQLLVSESKIFRPKGTRNWWKKMNRDAQVAYRKEHPFTKKKARLTDIIITKLDDENKGS